MGCKLKFNVYHGTDYNIARKIYEDGFICKENPEHWLGNGIYFYLDELLAKWWTTNPSKKFGQKIEQPAVIKCKLEAYEENVLDITKLNGYNRYVKMVNYYWKNYISKNPPIQGTEIRKVRCAFFDWIMRTQNIDVVIAAFHLPNQPYKEKFADFMLDNFSISYSEVQVCLNPQKQYLLSDKIIELIHK